MKTLAAMIMAVLLMLAPAYAAPVVITHDEGGVIIDYISKYSSMRDDGVKLVIAGDCASACTLFLGILPRTSYCVLETARLGFHTATFHSIHGPLHATGFTTVMWKLYPDKVHRVVKHLGWNGDHPEIPHTNVVWVEGRNLNKIAPLCSKEGTSG